GAARSPRSTSPPAMTASPWPTWSRTTTSTTRPTARATGTAPTTTARGTAAEGPTDDPAVNELRARQKRNFLVTLFLSQGVPMLLAGDEMGRTQAGNNNAYCQDSSVSWLDWGLAAAEQDLLQFTETLAGLRRDHAVFRRRRFFRGQVPGDEKGDIVWLTP